MKSYTELLEQFRMAIDALERYQRSQRATDLNQAKKWLHQIPDPMPLNMVSTKEAIFFLLHAAAIAALDRDWPASDTFMKRAEATAQEDPEQLSMVYNEWCNILSDRYDLSPDINTLNQAIDHAKTAVDVLPNDHRLRGNRLTNLGKFYLARFDQRRLAEDLHQALESLDQATHYPDKNDTTYRRRLHVHAVCYQKRFELYSSRQDIDQAIALLEQATQDLLHSNPDHPGRLYQLSMCLGDRFDLSKDPHDSEQASNYIQKAIEMVPQNDPNLSAFLNCLSLRLADKAEVSGQTDYLHQAIQITRQTLKNRALIPAVKNSLTINLVDYLYHLHLANRKDTKSLHASYKQIVSVLKSLSHNQGQTGHIHLKASRIAYSLYKAGYRKYEAKAITHAEQGRVLTCQQMQQMTNPSSLFETLFDAVSVLVELYLKQGKIELALEAIENSKSHRLPALFKGMTEPPVKLDRARLQQQMSIIDQLNNMPPLPPSPLLDTPENQVDSRLRTLPVEERRFVKNFDPNTSLSIKDLISFSKQSGLAFLYLYPNRDQQGFVWALVHGKSGFLSRPKVIWQQSSEIKASVLMAKLFGKFDNQGTVLQKGFKLLEYEHHLQSQAGKSVRELEQAWSNCLDDVLAYLEPVFREISKTLQSKKLSEVVIIPSLYLSTIPLHAVPIGAGQTLSDICTVRYANSARLYRYAYGMNSYTLHQEHVQAFFNPDLSLPFTEFEAETLTQIVPFDRLICHKGQTAQRDTIEMGALYSDVLVLSTHAEYPMVGPHTAGIRLAQSPTGGIDENQATLTLADIIEGAVVFNAGAAVLLPSCKTGQIDSHGYGIDDQFGFPTVLTLAGARSTLASFWSVDDFATSLFMEQVYKLHFGQGIPLTQTVQQAAQWLRTVTSREVLTMVQQKQAQVRTWKAQSSKNQRGHASKREYEQTLARLQAQLQIQQTWLETQPSNKAVYQSPRYWAAFALHGV